MHAGRLISDAWLSLLAAAAGGGNWLSALQHAGKPETLLAMDSAALRAAGLGPEQIRRLRADRPEPPASWQRWLAAADHALVPFGSEAYPPRLAAIADPPLALWVDASSTDLLGDPQLAIVGSRHPTTNGRTTAGELAAELARCGLIITSGLAAGIDAASHRGALEGQGATIAVLGCGIDTIYPRQNGALADQIRDCGAIVSEYPPGMPVRAFQFPQRNRIIAGLSIGTLVVEANRRSGSLITARLAADYGREVFAVPGSIHNPLSKGCHKLLRNGAALVETAGDILLELAPQLELPPAPHRTGSEPVNGQPLPPELARCLDFTPTAFEVLLTESGLTAAELSSMLLHLEFQGKIEALPGGRYCRLIKRS